MTMTAEHALPVSDNLAPIDFETDLPALRIHGNMPKSLNGVLVRNGPNPLFPSPDAHWFSGDGMLHAFSLANGTASYRNRWVRTQRWEAQRVRNQSLDFGFAPPQGQSDEFNDGAANTNVIWHGGRLLALEEAHLPVEIALPLLQTQGQQNFGKRLTGCFTAHPKKDPATGDLHFFGYGTPQPFSTGMVYGVVNASNEVVHLETFQAPYASMVHDMAITQNYVVIPIMPLTASMDRAGKGEPPFAWDASFPNQIGVFRRDLGVKSLRWYKGPASYVFHFMNAWEEGMHLYVDGMQFQQAPLFPNVDRAAPPPAKPSASLCRWHFDLEADGGSYGQTCVDDFPGEFPRIDDRYTGRVYRHGWFTGHAGHEHGKFGCIVHFDHRRRKRAVYHLPPGDSSSEVVFVPRYDRADEGDGWLLAVVFRAGQGRSDLMVLDALEVESGPVALAELPHRVPDGFHGSWIDAADLSRVAA